MKIRQTKRIDDNGNEIYLSYDDYGDLNSEVWEEDGIYSAKIHTPDGVKKIHLTEEDGKRMIEIARESYNEEQRERRRHVSLEALDPEDRFFTDDFDPLNELDKREKIRVLMDAIRQLPVSQQEVLKAYYWEGRNGVEIAEDTEKTTAAVYAQLKRATESLRRIILSDAGSQ